MATLAPKWSSYRRRRTTDWPPLHDNPEDSFFHGAIVALPFALLLWSCLVWAIHAAL